ncbi:MAG: YqjF family protein [Candidatus Poseidoniales archaeon]
MKTSHIPFSMPTRGWALSQNWVNLTFMHWEVDRKLLKKYIPEDLELETFKGKTYIGTIPFRMEKIRPRYLPSVPFISNFPEFNIRAYVSKNGISGVLFLTLDAESRITSMYAPWAYGLPYVFAKGKVEENEEGGFSWQSNRKSNGISIKGESKPSGSLRKAEKNSLEEFLFERYSLYVTLTKRKHILPTRVMSHGNFKMRLLKLKKIL